MQLHIDISGMHCEACVGAVRQAVSKLDGITRCDVRIGHAAVRYDDAMCNRADVLSAVRGAGAFDVDGFTTE